MKKLIIIASLVAVSGCVTPGMKLDRASIPVLAAFE